jgi:hypothetical protein
MQLGWTPKEDWHGDPAHWRPADVWLDRGEMLRNITQLKDKLTATERQVAEAFKKGVAMTEHRFKEEIASLREARKAAFQEGDLDRVDKIEDRIEVLKEQQKAETQRKPTLDPQTPPEFTVFLQRNPWYESNKRLRYMADAIGREFLENRPNATAADLYFFVEQEMQQNLGPTKKSPPAPDGGRQPAARTAAAGGGGSFSSIESQMSDEDRGIMNTLIKTGVFASKDEYLKEYSKVSK